MFTLEAENPLYAGNIAARHDRVLRGPNRERLGGTTYDGTRHSGHIIGIPGWVVSKDLKQVEQAMLRKIADMYGVKEAA